jgi:hypothetical protein
MRRPAFTRSRPARPSGTDPRRERAPGYPKGDGSARCGSGAPAGAQIERGHVDVRWFAISPSHSTGQGRRKKRRRSSEPSLERRRAPRRTLVEGLCGHLTRPLRTVARGVDGLHVLVLSRGRIDRGAHPYVEPNAPSGRKVRRLAGHERPDFARWARPANHDSPPAPIRRTPSAIKFSPQSRMSPASTTPTGAGLSSR